MQPKSRTNPKKVMQKMRQQTMQYYEGWTEESKKVEKKDKLYKHSVGLLVDNIKQKKELENRPVEIVEIPYEVIKIEEIEVPYEVIKEVEIIKRIEIPVEVEREVIKEVPVIKEIIKTVEVPVEVEVIREVPYEVIKEVTKKVFVTDKEEIRKLKEDFETRLKLEKLSKKANEKRYQVALTQSHEAGRRELMASFESMEISTKKYKRLATYAYMATPLLLSQILTWIIL